MPYIKRDRRALINPYLNKLLPQLETDGEVNYVISKIIDHCYNKKSYSKYNSAMGVLTCVILEYYRRRICEFENEKIIKNGDIF